MFALLHTHFPAVIAHLVFEYYFESQPTVFVVTHAWLCEEDSFINTEPWIFGTLKGAQTHFLHADYICQCGDDCCFTCPTCASYDHEYHSADCTKHDLNQCCSSSCFALETEPVPFTCPNCLQYWKSGVDPDNTGMWRCEAMGHSHVITKKTLNLLQEKVMSIELDH